MGFSFKNLFKKDKPQENTEHVSLEKSAESDSAKIEGRAPIPEMSRKYPE